MEWKEIATPQKSKQKVPHYRHYSVMKIKKEVYLEISSNIFLSL